MLEIKQEQHVARGIVVGRFVFDSKHKRGFLVTPDKQTIAVSIHPELRTYILTNLGLFNKAKNWVVYPSSLDPRSPNEDKLRLHLIKWLDDAPVSPIDQFIVAGEVKFWNKKERYVVVKVQPQTRICKPRKLTLFYDGHKEFVVGTFAQFQVERREKKLWIV